MSRPAPRPPVVSRRLLEWAARRLGAPELAADAADLFAERVRRSGEDAARRWYRRQVRASLAQVLMPRRKGAGGPAGPAWLAGFSLDAKLGARMIFKHPGITLVGGLAMTIGIGLGAASLEIADDLLHPTLPFHEGERIVGLRNFDQEANEPELRSVHDFVTWREALASIQDLGAFRSIERNLGAAEGPGEPAHGAEITPSAFRTLGASALLGRTLVDADEREGAPPVIVLGHRLWQTRFAGDPGIVGRSVRLGTSTPTVVGVMPEGFAFPVSHGFWTPFRPDAWAYERREGPAILMFGRLAPGADLDEARAELTSLGMRTAADFPATHARIRPQVMRYTELFIGGGGGGQSWWVGSIFVVLLLVLASNVATMVFARTATRENEIAMRFALGASRGQILLQFFVEAFVLALGATVLALAAVAWGAGWFTDFLWQVTAGEAPFWLEGDLNPSTVLYALALAVVGSIVAGVLPAFKATGSRLQTRLRDAAGASDSGLRFGGVWSAIIVVQVALAVLVVPPAIVAVAALSEPGYVDPGFPGEEYLSVRLELDLEGPGADTVGGQGVLAELERRLRAEPGISDVTFATRLPVMNHPQPWIQVERTGDSTYATSWVMSTSVDENFFDAFGAEVVAGRVFGPEDLVTDPLAVVVNEHFVNDVLGGRSAVGRRIRYQTRYGQRSATGQPRGGTRTHMLEPGDWYEIVGVVSGLGMDTNRDPFYPGKGPGVYHPLTRAAMGAGGSYTVRMAFHVRGDAAAFASRLRDHARAVHPGLRLYDVLPLDGPVDQANRAERLTARLFSWATALVALMALLVSVAGTYAVMSFTVARRTREIGIRVALGADRRRIVATVFSRAMAQIGVGLAVGVGVWFYVIVYGLGGSDRLGLLLATTLVLAMVGLVACGVPVWRALRIEPTDALREG